MKTYLGQGVFVQESGIGLVLTYERVGEQYHKIYLDGHVFNALLQYVEHMGGESPTTCQRLDQNINATIESQKAKRND